MPAFLEQRIDTRITRETTFYIAHPSRKIIRAQGGQIDQQFGDSPLKYHVNIATGIRSADAFHGLMDCFYVILQTPYTGLRVKNFADFRGTSTNTSLTLVSGTTWQLKRKHTFGGITTLRSITKPRSGVVVYDAGGSVLPSTTDTTTGQSVITGTPSYWVGEFDIPMTFSDNEWRAKLEVGDRNLHIVSEPVMMEELL